MLNLATKITSFSFVLLGKLGTSGQKKTTRAAVLFYYLCINLVEYLGECYCNIGKDFSVEYDIVFGHASYECTISVPFCFDCSRQSFDPKSSKISFFLFSAFVSMLSLFHQCQSHLFIYFASSESEPFCKSDKLFVSSLSLKPVCYSYHVNYWL